MAIESMALDADSYQQPIKGRVAMIDMDTEYKPDSFVGVVMGVCAIVLVGLWLTGVLG